MLSKAVLHSYHPTVIGITGSVGKTSTKDAVALVLSENHRVRATGKNFNNEIGVPLTILGAHSAGRSILGWVGTFLRGMLLLVFRSRRYPEVLVLEMAADRAGDIAYLTQLAPCHIGVLTAISRAHTEFLGTLDDVALEKAAIITHLGSNDSAILNADDPRVLSLRERTKARVITFGLSENADVRACNLSLTKPEGDPFFGVQGNIAHGNNTVQFHIPNMLGQHQLLAPLAAVAVAIAMNVPFVAAVKRLQAFQTPSGRMRQLAGIKHTLLIDDTYNSSPAAAEAALTTLAQIPTGGRKIAVLGDMAELGSSSDDDHRAIGVNVPELGIDLLMTVGPQSKKTAQAAKEHGMDDNHVFLFDDAVTAARFLQQRMEQGDTVLVKGSQVMRMEKAVKEVMAEPEQASALLVRQDKSWLRS